MSNGNLLKVKRMMQLDKEWNKTLIRSARNEILIDLDEDGQPDIALMDAAGDGDIDTLAVDLTGDGEFNLYFTDTDGNSIPDMVLLDENGNGTDMEVLGVGPEVEEALLEAAAALQLAIADDNYISAVIEAALDSLDDQVKQARKDIKRDADER
ncbi:MAG: hypothetical protein LUD18_03560 [Lachnospiraceae bacterium]|nr:hypothetical protein [Lachnospiraceae bacterium]